MTPEEIIRQAEKEITFWLEDYDGGYPPQHHSVTKLAMYTQTVIHSLIQKVKSLEAELSGERERVKALEEGVRNYLAGWDKDGPNYNTDILERLIEKEAL